MIFKVNNDEETAQERALLMDWMQGNEAATQFCEHFMYIIHLWDDLIDKDFNRSNEDINTAFKIMFNLMENQFYRNYYQILHPVIGSAINAWIAANEMEREKLKNDLDVAYSLRCNVLNVIVMAAQCCGGASWADKVGVEIWRHGMRESLDEYKKDLEVNNA